MAITPLPSDVRRISRRKGLPSIGLPKHIVEAWDQENGHPVEEVELYIEGKDLIIRPRSNCKS